jgi:hypothetical protein
VLHYLLYHQAARLVPVQCILDQPMHHPSISQNENETAHTPSEPHKQASQPGTHMHSPSPHLYILTPKTPLVPASAHTHKPVTHAVTPHAVCSPSSHLYIGGCPPEAIVMMLACCMWLQKSLCPLAASALTVAGDRLSTCCVTGGRLRQDSWNAAGCSLNCAGIAGVVAW